MPRSPRADEAGGLYHALNRANLGAKIFRKKGDFVAFEKVLYEALHLYQGRFKSFPIQDDDHFFVGCWYVERNALRAEMVTRAED